MSSHEDNVATDLPSHRAVHPPLPHSVEGAAPEYFANTSAPEQIVVEPIGYVKPPVVIQPPLQQVVTQRAAQAPSLQPSPTAYIQSVPQPAPASQPAPTPPPQAAPQPAIAHPPPNWPGLGVVETAREPTPASPFQNAPLRPNMTPAAFGHWEDEMTSPASTTKRPLWPLFVIGMFTLALCWFGWHALKTSAPIKKAIASAIGSPTANPQETRRAIPVATPKKQEIIPQAIRDRFTALDLGTAAADIVRKLNEATTTDDRLTVIYNPEENRADVERFFTGLGGPWKPLSMEAGVLITDLTTGQQIPIFKLMTEDFSTGLILRMIPDENKKLLLDWPLASQSHDLTFDHFISNSELPDGSAQWFTLMFKRTHDFALREPHKHSYDCFLMQGSFSASGNALVYVHQDSAIGRLLASRTDWNHTYIARALIAKTSLGTQRVHVLLDAETGSSAEK